MDPFLKWAGGKRWLARSSYLPRSVPFTRYVEPFVGSGAVYFSLEPKRALLSDLNSELIDLYIAMRDRPDELQAAMAVHQKRHNHDYYYDIRASLPRDQIRRAARTLYLNRTCWNGLYRVNLRGEFNVPIGTKTLVLGEHEDFSAYARILRSARIVCSDFEETIEKCRDGDFVFVDPPYTARHNKNGFLKYNESIFSWDDQRRLHAALQKAVERGAAIVVTNADHESVRELYADGFAYESLSRASVLAADASFRGRTSEALFTANVSAS